MKATDTVIDIVISWVNGRDPRHRLKMAPYLGRSLAIHDDINGDTRFNSEGEIFLCLASILRFAPFVNRIFIITDEQNPNVDEFVARHFPENNIPIIVVDHTVIFRGYEDILPVFNSLSIETAMYRIPDLSENFVYLNDDFFLMRPIVPSDWFRDDMPVAYGSWRNVRLDILVQKIKPKKNGHKPFGFKDSMLNATKALHVDSRYFCIEHTPLPLKKSIFEQYFNENQDKFRANINCKFREETQFNPQALFYLLAFEAGQCVHERKKKYIFIKPERRTMKYATRKMNEFHHNKDILFGCISSADQAAPEVREKLFNWSESLLGIR